MRVSFGGERLLHAWLRHGFSGQPPPQLHLVARAQQFSSYIVLAGRLVSATKFEPSCAVIVQNRVGPEHCSSKFLGVRLELLWSISDVLVVAAGFARLERRYPLSQEVWGSSGAHFSAHMLDCD